MIAMLELLNCCMVLWLGVMVNSLQPSALLEIIAQARHSTHELTLIMIQQMCQGYRSTPQLMTN